MPINSLRLIDYSVKGYVEEIEKQIAQDRSGVSNWYARFAYGFRKVSLKHPGVLAAKVAQVVGLIFGTGFLALGSAGVVSAADLNPHGNMNLWGHFQEWNVEALLSIFYIHSIFQQLQSECDFDKAAATWNRFIAQRNDLTEEQLSRLHEIRLKELDKLSQKCLIQKFTYTDYFNNSSI